MRFERMPRYQAPDRSPGRLAAAARAVKREEAKTPLFPEAQMFSTVDERLSQQEQACKEYTQRSRDLAARQWREARTMFRALPEEKKKKIWDYWHRPRHQQPGKAHYFADVVWHFSREDQK